MAIQLLWLNIVTDGIQDMALSFDDATNDVMNDKPRSPSNKIIWAVSRATSVPLPIATPILAAFNAGASLTPSPVTATYAPFLFNASTMACLSIEETQNIVLMILKIYY